MKKAFFLIFGAFLVFTNLARAESGLPQSVETSGGWAVYNKYVWRGFTLDEDSVIQTEINFKYGNATIGMWNNNDLTYNDAVNSAEMDYLFDYTFSIGKTALSAGYTYYTFPAASDFSKEYYIGVAGELPLSPRLTFYHDYKEKGDYINFGINQIFPVSNVLSLDISMEAGYNNKLFIAGKGANYDLKTAAPIRLTEHSTLTPLFGYSRPTGDLKSKSDGNQKPVMYAGLDLSCDF